MKNITRKDFIKRATLSVAGLSMIPDSMEKNRTTLVRETSDGGRLNLKNVRLETGFEFGNDDVIATRTGLFGIEIENGKISRILPNQPGGQAIDAKGNLMLPSFRDMHIHLDKTFYGERWKAVQKRSGGVKGMIELEKKLLPEMLKNSTHKAEKLIELLQSKGTGFARSHVNIEPTSGLVSLKNLQVALENKKHGFGAELVAFPQHGVFYTDSVPYLKEAAATDIDFIGGIDPYTIDGNIEKTIDFIVGLALDHHKGIDLHLHESGESGLKTVEYLIEKVAENSELKKKTYLSHCFVLGRLEQAKLEEIAEKLASARIGIVTTVPFGGLIMPIPTLYKYNVEVMTGNDSIIDHWNTFGTGSVLQKAGLMAQLYGYSTEFQLSRSLKLATGGILPLDDKGNRQWPKVGDPADLVFLEASCSAEAVSRVSPVVSLIYKGNLVF